MVFTKFKRALIVFGLVTACASAFADTTVQATGSGWCFSWRCNNTNTNTIDNTFAGMALGSPYRDWFAFDIGNENISAATLSIWNDGRGATDDPMATYSLAAASSISFSGLISSPYFGTVNGQTAHTGVSHYVDIAFNAEGVNFLNTHLGTRVVFGGEAPGPINNVLWGFFGFTNGSPTATLHTVSAVPEPESYALMLAGLGLVSAVARRRQQKRRTS